MEIMSSKWIPELEMEYPNFMQPCQMNPFDYPLDELNYQSFSCDSNSSYPSFDVKQDPNNMTSVAKSFKNNNFVQERPAKFPKTSCTAWNSTCDSTTLMMPNNKARSSSSSQIISFEKSNSNSPPTSSTVKPKSEVDLSSYMSQVSYDNLYCSSKGGFSSYRNPLNAQDHVIAERKRREKLSQRFIALSAIIPGLKKVDKASILGEAIRYMKELEVKVNKLEEQTSNRKVESVVYVKKSKLSIEGDISSSDESSDSASNHALPEIEARVSGKDVLIRIQCEKHKGVAAKILSELEEFHLNVINSSVLPFGNSILDMTVVAEMDVGFCMTMNDLVRNLRQALLSTTTKPRLA